MFTFCDWCFDHFTIDNHTFYANTAYEKPTLLLSNGCDEKIDFKKENKIILPGLNCPVIIGNWKLIGDTLSVQVADPVGKLYNTHYFVHLTKRQLVLESDSLSIHCFNALY